MVFLCVLSPSRGKRQAKRGMEGLLSSLNQEPRQDLLPIIPAPSCPHPRGRQAQEGLGSQAEADWQPSSPVFAPTLILI